MKKKKIAKRAASLGEIVENVLGAVNEDRDEEKQFKAKDIRDVLKTYHEEMLTQVADNGVFAIPGIVKIQRKFKPARAKRKGKNPFTGEMMIFKAKPASYAAKARPLAKVKEAAAG